MSKQKSAYGVVSEINNKWKADHKFGELMNTVAKRWDSWVSEIRQAMNQSPETFGVRSDELGIVKQFLMFLTWLLTVPTEKNGEIEHKKRPRFKTIKSFLPSNPNGDRTPKEILKAIKEGESLRDLKLWETERVELKEVDLNRGGLSVHRFVQISWGVFKVLRRNDKKGENSDYKLGDAFTRGDLTEEIVKKAAKVYKVEAVKRRLKSREETDKESEQSDSTDTVVQDMTTEHVENGLTPEELLAQLENKEIKTGDIPEEHLEAIHSIATGGIKGAITRRMNA